MRNMTRKTLGLTCLQCRIDAEADTVKSIKLALALSYMGVVMVAVPQTERRGAGG